MQRTVPIGDRLVSMKMLKYLKSPTWKFVHLKRNLSHVETKIYSGAFCLRQNAQRAALRAAGQATSGKKKPVVLYNTFFNAIVILHKELGLMLIKHGQLVDVRL